MKVERIVKKDGSKIYYILENGKVTRRVLICKAQNLLNNIWYITTDGGRLDNIRHPFTGYKGEVKKNDWVHTLGDKPADKWKATNKREGFWQARKRKARNYRKAKRMDGHCYTNYQLVARWG